MSANDCSSSKRSKRSRKIPSTSSSSLLSPAKQPVKMWLKQLKDKHDRLTSAMMKQKDQLCALQVQLDFSCNHLPHLPHLDPVAELEAHLNAQVEELANLQLEYTTQITAFTGRCQQDKFYERSRSTSSESSTFGPRQAVKNKSLAKRWVGHDHADRDVPPCSAGTGHECSVIAETAVQIVPSTGFDELDASAVNILLPDEHGRHLDGLAGDSLQWQSFDVHLQQSSKSTGPVEGLNGNSNVNVTRCSVLQESASGFIALPATAHFWPPQDSQLLKGQSPECPISVDNCANFGYLQPVYGDSYLTATV